MDDKTPVALTVSHSAIPGKGSLILVECANEAAAYRLAAKIAEETGRAVTIRDADMHEVGTVLAPTAH